MNIPALDAEDDCPRNNRNYLNSSRAGLASVVAVLALALSPLAFAELTGQACVQDEGGASCSANDVRITAFECVDCPDTCDPNVPYTATVIAEVESGPERYDVGFFFTEDGTSAYSGDSCTREILSPVTEDASACMTSAADGLGPFASADADACGDTPGVGTCDVGNVELRACSEGGGICAVTRRMIEITTACVDADADNIADIHACTAWSQSEGDVCNGILDAVPGTPSKCSCDFVSTVEIRVEPDCEVDADCADPNLCNGAEMCVEGVCEAGEPLVCDDGAYCNGEEVCDPLDGCLAATPVDCSEEDDQCNVGVCDEATDACVADFSGTQGDACNDDLFCTTGDVCTDGDCGGDTNECGDGVSCTVDSCDEDSDACVNQADDSLCDNDEFCDGEETCDPLADCQSGTPPEVDDGVSCTEDECVEASDSVTHTPLDSLCADGNICNGDETCDPLNDCQPGENEDPGTACGDQTDTACTDPDTCDGDGLCLNNNEVCGALTTSALCDFDVEPDKGVCVGGEEDGQACSLGDPEDCVSDGGECVHSKEFLVGFSPDTKNKAYRLTHTNPGQFYYNAFYDGSVSGGDGDVIAIVVPYPFITQGATPLHVYDGDQVGTLETCFMPGEALRNERYVITLDDWIQPDGYVAPDYLSCDQVLGPNGSGFCTVLIDIPEELILAAADKLLYINLHLDYGFKGQYTDANPWDWSADKYDRGSPASPWGSRDALVDTNNNSGPVAIQDCSDYNFSHYDESGLLFDDSGVNLNIFSGGKNK